MLQSTCSLSPCALYAVQLKMAQFRNAESQDEEEVILHTAGVWRWSSEMETGNFVPDGQLVPFSVKGQV